MGEAGRRRWRNAALLLPANRLRLVEHATRSFHAAPASVAPHSTQPPLMPCRLLSSPLARILLSGRTVAPKSQHLSCPGTMDEARERLERCARENEKSLDLSGLRLGTDGAREVARLLPSW